MADGEGRKPLSLDVTPDVERRIRDGCSHVAVRFWESNDGGSGSIVEAGTEEECKAALPPRIVVVPNGLEHREVIWTRDELFAGTS